MLLFVTTVLRPFTSVGKSFGLFAISSIGFTGETSFWEISKDLLTLGEVETNDVEMTDGDVTSGEVVGLNELWNLTGSSLLGEVRVGDTGPCVLIVVVSMAGEVSLDLRHVQDIT